MNLGFIELILVAEFPIGPWPISTLFQHSEHSSSFDFSVCLAQCQLRSLSTEFAFDTVFPLVLIFMSLVTHTRLRLSWSQPLQLWYFEYSQVCFSRSILATCGILYWSLLPWPALQSQILCVRWSRVMHHRSIFKACLEHSYLDLQYQIPSTSYRSP